MDTNDIFLPTGGKLFSPQEYQEKLEKMFNSGDIIKFLATKENPDFSSLENFYTDFYDVIGLTLQNREIHNLMLYTRATEQKKILFLKIVGALRVYNSICFTKIFSLLANYKKTELVGYRPGKSGTPVRLDRDKDYVFDYDTVKGPLKKFQNEQIKLYKKYSMDKKFSQHHKIKYVYIDRDETLSILTGICMVMKRFAIFLKMGKDSQDTYKLVKNCYFSYDKDKNEFKPTYKLLAGLINWRLNLDAGAIFGKSRIILSGQRTLNFETKYKPFEFYSSNSIRDLIKRNGIRLI